MLNVIDIELAFPERTESLAEVAEVLSLSRNQNRMFERFFGFGSFHHDDTLPQQDMMAAAIGPLVDRNGETAARISHVAHCHTLPSTAVLSGPTSPVLEPFRARGIEVFSATMNHCATGITMLGAMDRLLNGADCGLILIGEKAFHPDIRLIENTTIMGEAAVAILVGRSGGRFQVLDTFTRHDTRFWQNTGHRDEAFLDGFDEAYLPFVCDTLRAALARFGKSVTDIHMVLPHNVNASSWLQVAQDTGFGRGKVWLSTIGRVGHCFGADPFINLVDAEMQGALSPGDLVILFSVGLGATASCALVEIIGETK
jgi:3-oxoacyl-[acyl-carrier-protein] synthase III